MLNDYRETKLLQFNTNWLQQYLNNHKDLEDAMKPQTDVNQHEKRF